MCSSTRLLHRPLSTNSRYLVFRRRNFHSLESPPLTRSYGLNWSRGTGSPPKGWLPRQISHSRGWTTRYWKRGPRLLVYTSRTFTRRLLPIRDKVSRLRDHSGCQGLRSRNQGSDGLVCQRRWPNKGRHQRPARSLLQHQRDPQGKRREIYPSCYRHLILPANAEFFGNDLSIPVAAPLGNKTVQRRSLSDA